LRNASWSSCRRSHPARVARRVGQRAARHAAFALRKRARPLGHPPVEATMRSLSLRPEDSLPIPRMGLPMGFKVLVSRHPAIAATRLLTVASVGLPPTERVRLRWTHFRTVGFPQYGFKASLSARACPGRDEVKPTPGMPPSPSEFTPRLRARNGDNLGTQPVRPEAGNPARSAPRTTPLTPGVLSSGRVMLSRPSSLIRPHAPVSGAPGDFTVLAAYTPGPRWAGAPEATPETFPTFAVGLWARAADRTPVGSPPPPVVFWRRYQASPSSARVAPHNTRLCQQCPARVRFDAASFA